MKKLLKDIRAHKRASVFCLVYWISTLMVVQIRWNGGIPGPLVALLFTNSLIAGAFVGWWRGPTPEHTTHWRERISGGMLIGVLSVELIFLLMKGGAGEAVIGWINRGDLWGLDEVLGFAIITGIIGAFLGLGGAACAVILNHRARLKP